MESRQGVFRITPTTPVIVAGSAEAEAKQLTDIGNAFQIRHSETTQERLHAAAQVDYLFHRLFSLVYLILRAGGGLG